MRFFNLRLVLLATLISLSSVVVASDNNWQAPEAAKHETNPVASSTQSIARGSNLFARHCIACHGYEAQGDGVIGLALDSRPANLLQIIDRQSAGEFVWKVKNGNGDMPAFTSILDPGDVWHIVNFIHSLEKPQTTSGESVVLRRCATCHGMAGVSYIEGWPDLPQLKEEDIINKLKAHRARIIEDSTMSKVTVDLSDEEIRQAAAYYASLNMDREESE